MESTKHGHARIPGGKVATMKRNRRKQGFTLIEIMIVVLIIGILLAIAVPNFIRARATSRLKAIEANLTQINQATSQYYMDNQLAAGAAPPAIAALSPSWLPNTPTGPLDNNYVVALDANNNPDSTYDGKDINAWQTACTPDPTAAACGL